MKKMTASEIRNMWLTFFKSKGHHIEPGSSLIPKNDPTLLWINAGVAALKKYFDGSEIPPSRRITNAQKSIRTNDIEHVGHTARHHTFFEMLGNFSIGDYFRKEVIEWASELLFDDKWFGFPKDKIYITYHTEDLETKKAWLSHGVDEDHLIPMASNFWEIGEGPCGPDTEMFFDRGEKYDKDNIGIDLLKEDKENDRYVEIWNIVFSQYNSEQGKERKDYKELPSKNIDTGAGLERFACIIQQTDTNFETDLFWPIIEVIEKQSKKEYSANKLAFRVIADHIRAITFALADGEMFSNEGRGYVLRRLLRRAERYGKVLEINHPFLYELVDTVSKIMSDFYPYLLTKSDFIKKMIKGEEEKFLKTLENGESLLNKSISKTNFLDSETMFKLYDTFGFPKELTMEICLEKGVEVDLVGFNRLMEEQKKRARKARGNLQSMNKQSQALLNCTLTSTFTYGFEPIETKVIALFNNGEQVDVLTSSGDIMLEETIFYAESGGQVADTGVIQNDDFSCHVRNVTKAPNKQFLHHVDIMFGEIKVGDSVKISIDQNRRLRIMRNHSSVHLLQEALVEVLGDHISQQGSYVCEDYSRFDFNHFEKISLEQLNEVEKRINTWINQAISCKTQVLPIEEAKKIGAKALFDDKYGDHVRVVSFGDVSKEFCGGTHVSNSSDIGLFVIEFEESIASGIRRIQARTSYGAYELVKKRETIFTRLNELLNIKSLYDLPNRVITLLQDNDKTHKNNELLSNKIALLESEKIRNDFIESNGLNILISYQKGKKRDDLISLIDHLKTIVTNYLIVLIGNYEGSLPITVSCSSEAINKGFKAGEIVKKIAPFIQGSGGGRPEIASGAGKDDTRIDEALQFLKGQFFNE